MEEIDIRKLAVEKRYKEDIERSAENLRKERMFLEVLCRDYTSVYYFDLNNGTLEILKMDGNANAASMVGSELRKKFDYSKEMRKYCSTYVCKEGQKEFLEAMSSERIQKELLKSDKYTYRYQSDANMAGQSYFEAQAVRIADKEFDNTAILAFRHIDDIIASERKRQEELKSAL